MLAPVGLVIPLRAGRLGRETDPLVVADCDHFDNGRLFPCPDTEPSVEVRVLDPVAAIGSILGGDTSIVRNPVRHCGARRVLGWALSGGQDPFEIHIYEYEPLLWREDSAEVHLNFDPRENNLYESSLLPIHHQTHLTLELLDSRTTLRRD
jgi:hypothetical protein